MSSQLVYKFSPNLAYEQARDGVIGEGKTGWRSKLRAVWSGKNPTPIFAFIGRLFTRNANSLRLSRTLWDTNSESPGLLYGLLHASLSNMNKSC